MSVKYTSRSKLIIQITFNASNIITDSKIICQTIYVTLIRTKKFVDDKEMRQHIERHVTTKLREVAYARLVPTSTPQNGNILSLKYLVKLIGLNGKEELMISAENTTSALFFFQHQVLLGQNTLKLDGSNWREKIRNGESVGKIEAT
uniref:Uncharacterized protein n=1 Tax=Rhizophagus irregularis (strain DAOM 181602 / DAOM 197198 / MUCL 43194) TaxID=747089 RepID=U9SH73_RHIID